MLLALNEIIKESNEAMTSFRKGSFSIYLFPKQCKSYVVTGPDLPVKINSTSKKLY